MTQQELVMLAVKNAEWTVESVIFEDVEMRVGVCTGVKGLIGTACSRIVFKEKSPLGIFLDDVELPGVCFCVDDLAVFRENMDTNQFRKFLGMVIAHEIGHIVDFSTNANKDSDTIALAKTENEAFADSYAIQLFDISPTEYESFLFTVKEYLNDSIKESCKELGFLRRKLAYGLTVLYNHIIMDSRKKATKEMCQRVVVQDTNATIEIETVVDFVLHHMDKNQTETT